MLGGGADSPHEIIGVGCGVDLPHAKHFSVLIVDLTYFVESSHTKIFSLIAVDYDFIHRNPIYRILLNCPLSVNLGATLGYPFRRLTKSRPDHGINQGQKRDGSNLTIICGLRQ